MKASKKWLEETAHSNWTWEEDAEAAWRAALEWYYKTAEHISPSDYEILEGELKK